MNLISGKGYSPSCAFEIKHQWTLLFINLLSICPHFQRRPKVTKWIYYFTISKDIHFSITLQTKQARQNKPGLKIVARNIIKHKLPTSTNSCICVYLLDPKIIIGKLEWKTCYVNICTYWLTTKRENELTHCVWMRELKYSKFTNIYHL